jgi:hypothetical protein
MPLEDTLDRLIGALNANTEAHGGKPSARPNAAAVAGKPPGALPPKVTMEQVKAAVMALKDAMGRPAALKVIKDAGGAAELNAIKPAKYAAVLAKCAEMMGEGESDDATDATAEADDDNL